MSIASEITRLQNAKAAIKAAIEAKGVDVGDETLDEYADLIEEISGEDENFEKLINRSITTIDVPEGVDIGGYTFAACARLVSITLPSTLTKLQQSVFQDCISLQSINIPNNVTEIAATAFTRCRSLSDVKVSNNIVNIGTSCFQTCINLTEIELPTTLLTINQNAFSGCSALATVVVKATTPPTIGANVFANNASGRKIYVPAASVNAYKTATNWSAYASDIEAIPTNS